MRVECNNNIWAVWAEWFGSWVPVFEPRNGDFFMDIIDCLDYVREMERQNLDLAA